MATANNSGGTRGKKGGKKKLGGGQKSENAPKMRFLFCFVFCTLKSSKSRSYQKQLSNGLYTEMVLLDIQKAFDSVNHSIFCKKLSALGVKSTTWFEWYLNCRSQIVSVKRSDSEPMAWTCKGTARECFVSFFISLLCEWHAQLCWSCAPSICRW